MNGPRVLTGAVAVTDLGQVLALRQMPTVTMWNRLEGRPRTENFDRALKAEVRDALWMLTRQWQLGEFRGDDAGSPVLAKVHLSTTRLRKYQAKSNPVQPFDDDTPLEAKVERCPIAFSLGGCDVALDLRLLMGRQWLKLMHSIGDFAQDFITAYPIHTPDPTEPRDAPICAHPEAWSRFAAAGGRLMDGAKLYQYLVSDSTHHAYDGIPALIAHASQVDEIAQKFVAWFDRLVYRPPASGEDAWEPSQLEYRFACSAPAASGERVLVAEEYYHGRLEWYNFDVDPTVATLGEGNEAPDSDLPAPDTRTVIPAPVVFEGMPNTRWWKFEDRRTNFGDVKPDTTDLAKLLLIEFALVYANDWYVIPHSLPQGSIVRILGMAVTNVFGERTWIEPAGGGPDDAWQRWAMFLLNIKGKGNEPADTSLLLLPTVPKVQEGRPLEEILLIRDEVANMVWGVERTIPLPSGDSKPGREAARETLMFFQRDLARRLGEAPGPPPTPPAAKIRYEVMTSVPENWIPFVPVHVDGNKREIQLQRGAMPRILKGDPEDTPQKVHPRTALLRKGLDQDPQLRYFLHEEEVPRAGVRVTESFQRTRWRDGRVWVWLGVRKQTGRGEGSSGLAFDRIVDMPPRS
jgi:hypothetical protein